MGVCTSGVRDLTHGVLCYKGRVAVAVRQTGGQNAGWLCGRPVDWCVDTFVRKNQVFLFKARSPEWKLPLK